MKQLRCNLLKRNFSSRDLNKETSNLDSLFTIASQLNQKIQFKREKKIKQIDQSISNLLNITDNNLKDNSELKELQKKRENLLFSQEKMKITSFQPKGQLENPLLNIPYLHQLTAEQWREAKGRELVIRGMKEFGLIGEIFDENDFRFLSYNLSIEYDQMKETTPSCPNPIVAVRRGNFIYPWITLTKPKSIKCQFDREGEDGGKKNYSLLLVDFDYPDEQLGRKIIYCLWHLNHLPVSKGSGIDFEGGKEELEFIAPHPFRGTEYHRFAFILFSNSDTNPPSFPNSPFSTLLEPNVTQSLGKRVLDIKLFMQHHTPVGICFFRTTWSKQVGEYLKKELGLRDPVFGIPSQVFNQKTTIQLGNRYKYC